MDACRFPLLLDVIKAALVSHRPAAVLLQVDHDNGTFFLCRSLHLAAENGDEATRRSITRKKGVFRTTPLPIPSFRA